MHNYKTILLCIFFALDISLLKAFHHDSLSIDSLSITKPKHCDTLVEWNPRIEPYKHLVDSLELFQLVYKADSVVPVEKEVLIDRLNCIESEVPLTYASVVEQFVEYFTNKRKVYTETMLEREQFYFPIFERYLKKYNLPDELKYLSIVESGLNPQAVSRSGAEGLWQFMPLTGKYMGLKQDYYIDERRDPEKATDAACRYLKMLYDQFDDWQLALAAYNCGPGNVRKAKRRAAQKNSFWNIYWHLPRETRSYVPQFIAIMYAMEYSHEHNIYPLPSAMIKNEYKSITIDGYLNLKVLANLTDSDYDEISFLNPSVKRGYIPDNYTNFNVNLPLKTYDSLMNNWQFIIDSSSKMTEKVYFYTVKSGNSLSYIAHKHNVSIADLKKWNNLNSNLIHPGQNLRIIHVLHNTPVEKKKANNNQSVKIVEHNRSSKLSSNQNSAKVHIVQPGDTLWNLSREYDNISTEELIRINELKSKVLTPGQKLIVG